MLIILDAENKKVTNNLGTNSLIPDGNVPIEEKENEIYVRLHDDSDYAKQILSAYDYELVLDENNKVIDVIVHKTLEEYRSEQPNEPQPPTAEERIDMLESMILIMMEG